MSAQQPSDPTLIADLVARTLDSEGVCTRCGAPDVHCFCPDFTYEERMALARSKGVNEYGSPVALKVCATCGREFTICPPSETFGPDCLGSDCPSYDIERDVDYLMLDHELRHSDDQ